MLQFTFWETTLKRYASFLSTFALLGFLTLLLPACGGNEIKGQKPPETVLNSDSTPTPEATQDFTLGANPTATPQVSSGEDMDTASRKLSKSVARSYAEKIARVKASQSTQSIQVLTTPTPEMTPTAEPVMTPTAVAAPAPPMETTTNTHPRKGPHWILWLIILILLGGGAYWYWLRSKEDDNTPYQPHPPVGGLSPVSGYTVRKKPEAPKKPSFWKRKLF